jgi:hypothetical protein
LKEKVMTKRATSRARTIDPVTNLWRFRSEIDEPDGAIDVDPDSADLTEPEEASDLELEEMPCTNDDSHWEAFIPDEDERDPEPEAGDFWIGQIAEFGSRIGD